MIDQQAVNELVDYALDHGVTYLRYGAGVHPGLVGKVHGMALETASARAIPDRDQTVEFFPTIRGENSIAMYRQSFKDLQVDYIDYYLLHAIGNGGIQTFRARYVDNGMIDFLRQEREAGRIRNLGFSFHGTQPGVR